MYSAVLGAQTSNPMVVGSSPTRPIQTRIAVGFPGPAGSTERWVCGSSPVSPTSGTSARPRDLDPSIAEPAPSQWVALSIRVHATGEARRHNPMVHRRARAEVDALAD